MIFNLQCRVSVVANIVFDLHMDLVNGPVHQKPLRSVTHWLAGSIYEVLGSNLSRGSDVFLSENPNHLRLAARMCFPALSASYTYQLRVLIGSLDCLRPCDWSA